MTTPDFFAEEPVEAEIPDFFADEPKEVVVKKEEPDFFQDEKEESPRELLENVSPLAQSFVAQSLAFSSEAGRKGVTEGGKRQLSGLTFGLSELIPNLKTETPKTSEDKTLAIGNEIMGSLLSVGAFEKYVIAPIGTKVGSFVAAKAVQRKIIKGLATKLATKFVARGTLFPAITALKSFIRSGDLPSLKDLTKEGLIVGGIGGSLDVLGDVAFPVAKSLSNIAKSEGRPLWDVYKQFGRAVKNRGFSFLKGTAKPATPEKVLEIGQDFVAEQGFPVGPTEEVPVVKPIQVEKPQVPFTKVDTTKFTPSTVPQDLSPAGLITVVPPQPQQTPDINKNKTSLSDAIVKDSKVAQIYNKFMNSFDIERPFVKVGANETGFHIKNYFSKINKTIEQANVIKKDIKKLKLSKEESQDLVLASEKATPPADPKLAKARELVRKYFDDTKKELIQNRVLKDGFIENQIDKIQNEIDDIRSKVRETGISRRRKREFLSELSDLKNELKTVEGLEFVSIPSKLWFESKTVTDPALLKRVIKFQSKRRRKTLRIQDLLDKGVITKEDLNIDDIISYNSRKVGRDLALANIINAAEKDGLASLEPVKNFVKIPGFVAPELAKFWIHPALAEFVATYTEPIKMNSYDKIVQISKGYAFYNPVFLPLYDVVQQLPVLLSNLKSLPAMPKIYIQSVTDVIKTTPNFWEAFENGLFSQVIIPKEATLEVYAKDNINPDKSPVGKLVTQTLNLPKKVHDKFYAGMQTIAWGADRIIRMATYNLLKRSGLSPREAAQLGSQFHGDYAKMPPKIRRQLNRFIFTPTFQSLMIRLPFTLAKGGVGIGKAILKGEKVPVRDRKAFEGFLGMLAVILGLDFMLKSTGWERDFFGYRYKKEVDGKEMVLAVSLPFNALLKWTDIIFGTLLKKGEDRNFFNMMRRLKFRASRPVQMVWEIAENRAPNKDLIVNPGDSNLEKTLKLSEYIFGRTFALYGDFVKQQRIQDPEAQKLLEKEFPTLFAKLPLFFPYLRSKEPLRRYNKIQRIYRLFSSELSRLAKKGKTMSEKDKQKFLKAMREAK